MTTAPTAHTAEVLASWHEGQAKQAIIEFVKTAIAPGSEGFVPPAQRIAVFDNDGTLWAEKPLYFQLIFAIDRVKTLAPMHPEWQTTQPFQAVLEADWATLVAGGEQALMALIMATHAGNTTEEFAQIVRDWLTTAKHPATGQPYTAMVYQPMLELLNYLRAHEFKTYIVSGGGIEFMRVFAEDVYGISPEYIIGSSIKTQFEWRDGQTVLVRLPEVHFINDGPGKPVGIHEYIGRRPLAAFGNADGDLQMLQWTKAGGEQHLAVLIHHTDAEREWAYDRDSITGRLDTALDAADQNGWVVVDMQHDWRRIFPHTPSA